jgi:hypothetical protein
MRFKIVSQSQDDFTRRFVVEYVYCIRYIILRSASDVSIATYRSAQLRHARIVSCYNLCAIVETIRCDCEHTEQCCELDLAHIYINM